MCSVAAKCRHVCALSLSQEKLGCEREKRRRKAKMANIATFRFLLLWTLFLCFAFTTRAAQRGEILYFALKLKAELIRIWAWMCLNFVLFCFELSYRGDA